MLELNHQFRVVDVHARLGGEDAAATEALEREYHQAGVVRGVVHPTAEAIEDGDEGYVRANNAVARQTVERSLVAFGRITGPQTPGEGTGSRLRNLAARRGPEHTSPEDVRRYAYDDRFHGFKLDPGRDGLPDEETLAALADVGLPVLVHAGRRFPPAELPALLEWEFPTIAAHFGGYPLDRALMDAALGLLARHDSLYLDTSAVRFRDLLERAVREHPDRVLFGSGAPDVHPSTAVMEILTLDVPEDAMARVFSKNAARVIEPLAADA
jgi:hypothetical protein